MTMPSRPLRLVHVAIASAAVIVLWSATACNGVLGNEILDADAGSPVDASVGDSAVSCPVGQKFCSAINSCGPANDPAFGCGAASCAPCSFPNATAKCGGTGCVIDTCFPGFLECSGTCIDISEAANCGKCGNQCPVTAPFCSPTGAQPPALAFTCAATCTAPQEPCGKQCVDLTKTAAHCGTCANDCRGSSKTDPPGGQWACVSSQCKLECLPGYHACHDADAGGAVVCVRQDAAHCGSSCNACPTGPNSTPQCTLSGLNYTCTSQCNVAPFGRTFTACPPAAGCFDLSSDMGHCGACNTSCVLKGSALGACSCVNSACTPATSCVPKG